MKSKLIPFLALLLLAVLAAHVPTSAAAVTSSINGGNITAAATITTTNIKPNADGSFTITVDVSLNGAHRVRPIDISSDGLTFAFDGVAVASPPAALQTLGAHMAAATPKINAALSAPAVIALLTAP